MPGFTFVVDGNSVTCDWITSDPALPETRRAEYCNKQTSDILDSCPTSCDFCDCVNNTYFKFDVLITNCVRAQRRKPVGCDWLVEHGITPQEKINRFKRWCEGDADV